MSEEIAVLFWKIKLEKLSGFLIGFGIFLAFVFLILFLANQYYSLSSSIDSEKFGQFGDVVGGVIGTFWALAGVILFYTGLVEQRKDIKANVDALEKQNEALIHQKEEMELLRNEYAMARSVFEQQKDLVKQQLKTSRIQQFESNFYSMMKIYIEIRNDLKARHVFNGFIDEIHKIDLKNVTNKNKILIICESLAVIFFKYKEDFAPYLRLVYRIFKLIDEADDFSPENKYAYSKVMRSQFSENELIVMYYNAHCDLGHNFRALILRFNLLKHLSLMSKVEFKNFNSSYEAKNNKIDEFSAWFDLFIVRALNRIHDIEGEYSSASERYSIDSSCFIDITISVTESSGVIFDLDDQNDFLNRHLWLGNHAGEFIEHYFFDRFINSRFEKIESNNFFSISQSDGHFVFEFRTDDFVSIIVDMW
jgi:hypothetical protein